MFVQISTYPFTGHTQVVPPALLRHDTGTGHSPTGRFVAPYDLLLRTEPSPIIGLNRAVAVAMRDGPAKGLELVDGLLERGELAQYHLAHATRADFCRLLNRTADARASCQRALALAKQEPERRFLEKRLAELQR